MTRRICPVLMALLFVARAALATCDGTLTTNRGVCKPNHGAYSGNWETVLNPNYDLLDFTCTPPLTCASTTIALGTVGMANGGTGTGTNTKGDLLVGTGSGWDKVAVGTDGQGLVADSTQTTGVKWGTTGSGTTLPVVDTQSIAKGSSDPTKKVRFEVDGISTGTTRVITMPDADVTLGAVGNQTANTVYAGPTTGSAATPTFRLLVDDDIPSAITRDSEVNVQGTSNEITSSASGLNPTLSIASTFRIGGKAHTAPFTIATTTPGTCSVGDLHFDSDATAGQNIYGCTATNTWTLESGGGGGGSNHDLLDGSVDQDTLAGSVVLGDLIAGNSTPKWARVAGNTTTTKKFLSQTGNGSISATPSWAQPAETDLTFTDVTTNNSSTSNHGFLKKLDNTATHYMDGTGGWSVPAGASAIKPFLNWSANQGLLPTSGYADRGFKGDRPALRYDPSSDECAYFEGVLGSGYNGGGLTVDLFWSSDAGVTTGATGWLTAFERYESTLDLTSSGFASNNSISTTTSGTAERLVTSTIAHTDGAQIDSLAAGEGFRLRVCRDGDGSTVTDSMTGDAFLYKVDVKEP